MTLNEIAELKTKYAAIISEINVMGIRVFIDPTSEKWVLTSTIDNAPTKMYVAETESAAHLLAAAGYLAVEIMRGESR